MLIECNIFMAFFVFNFFKFFYFFCPKSQTYRVSACFGIYPYYAHFDEFEQPMRQNTEQKRTRYLKPALLCNQFTSTNSLIKYENQTHKLIYLDFLLSLILL